MEQRRLAAIMFTDIVGYTALMGSDEDRAFNVLRKNREIHNKFIQKYQGALIKEMGDGMLISFNLASEAVRCAIEIQKVCKDQNIPLKIGIHEGEMVFEGNDVLGDGVNIAARIQDGAEEGCIMISGSVYRDIKNKADIQTEFVEERQFKNVDEKIRIFKVKCGEENSNNKEQISGLPHRKASKSPLLNSKKKVAVFAAIGFFVMIIIVAFLWQDGRNETSSASFAALEEQDKSIAVKPFRNLSTDQANEHWVNGMMEDIRNNLAKIPDLRVVSSTTMQKYRDTKLTAKEISEEVGVSYLLEGSVQKVDNQLKIHAQLILGSVDDHLWQETYIRDVSDVSLFDIQSDIAKTISNMIGLNISQETREIIEAIPTTDMTAYELFIKGWYELGLYWKTYDGIHLENSNNLLDLSLEIDSNYVDALQAKAVVIQQLTNDPDSMNYWVDKALKNDPDNPQANFRKAGYYRLTGKFDLAIAHYQKSLQFNPDNRTLIYLWLGRIYCLQKRDLRKGYPYLMKSIGSIGERKSILAWLARTFSALGEYEKAELWVKAYMKSGFNDCEGLFEYNLILITKGNYDRALHFTDSICPSVDCDIGCNGAYVLLHAYRKEFSNAEQYIKKWEDQRGRQVLSISKGYVYHKMGRIKEADEVFQEILKRQAQRLSNTSRPPDGAEYFFRAQILAFQNRKDEALQSIKEIDKMGFNFNLFDRMTHDPMFENLWEDPEFKAILKKVQDEKASVRAQIREIEEQAKLDM